MKNPSGRSTTVAVSSLLRERHPGLFRDLWEILDRCRINHQELEETRDIWVRDYCLIQRHDGKFVSFTYKPDYLRKSYRYLITDWKKVRPLPGELQVVDSGLILDGGNMVLHDRVAIITHKIFIENPQLSHIRIEEKLKESFGLERTIFIPNEPGDIWGHADGMVAWAGEDRVLMNDYRKIDCKLHRKLKSILSKAKLDVVEIPYAPDLSHQQIPSAEGSYVNMLILPEIVIVPAYNIPSDDQALARIASEFPDRALAPIDASSIAREGGSVHCVTSDWTCCISSSEIG